MSVDELKSSEYNSLRSELQMRINNMYNHNYSIITLVIAVWAFIISGFIDCSSNGVFTQIKPLTSFIALLPMSIALIVLILMAQWNENIMSISDISAYIIVNHELTNILDDNKKSNIYWETHSTANLFMANKAIWFSNLAYLIVSIGSVILSVILFGFSVAITSITSWNTIVAFILLLALVTFWVIIFLKNRVNIGELKRKAVYRNLLDAIKTGNITSENARNFVDKYIFSKYDEISYVQNKTKFGRGLELRNAKIEELKNGKEFKEFISLLEVCEKKSKEIE